jgi:hypothetical protein
MCSRGDAPISVPPASTVTTPSQELTAILLDVPAPSNSPPRILSDAIAGDVDLNRPAVFHPPR